MTTAPTTAPTSARICAATRAALGAIAATAVLTGALAGPAAAAGSLPGGEPIMSPTNSPWGPGPGAQTIVTTDLDDDDVLDVVVTDFATTTPRALLGNGDGSFGAPQPLPASDGVLSIATGDFDNDGVADIAGHSEFSVVVWTGNGDGTFALHQTYNTLGNVQPAIAAGDVDGDGLDDVVVPVPQGVQTYLGTGTGITAGPTSNAFGLISDVAFGNFDGDTRPDIVVTDATPFAQRARVLLGTGDGGFVESGSSTVGFGPEAATVADLDGDGIDDVVTSDSFSFFNTIRFSVSVLLSDGNGGFRSRVTHPVGAGPVSGAAGDLDGDGDPDIAISNVGSGDVSLFVNDGSGALADAGAVAPVSLPQTPAIADVNHDGANDLVVAGLDALGVLLGG